tara:strand:- start:477 stop:1214 length:738 start_codon:yes stop_codon:yes gene_type:complete
MKKLKFLIIITLSYVFGLISFRNELFPLNLYRTLVHGSPIGDCPVVDKTKLFEIREIFSNIQKGKSIFWGNSVVEGMHDSRFYGANKFVEIGHSGQVLRCALNEVDFLISAQPEEVLIYLGGNDADGQSGDSPKEVIIYYEKIVDKLLAANIKVILHQIHYASKGLKGELTWGRDWNYVEKLNKGISEIANKNKLLVIPPLNKFKYFESKDEIRKNSKYTYDGEHLTVEGYKIWIEHIKKWIPYF